MAVGKESFEDCPMLQWSLGCTGAFDPTSPPMSWMARLLEAREGGSEKGKGEGGRGRRKG